jgi:hypothetical protein
MIAASCVLGQVQSFRVASSAMLSMFKGVWFRGLKFSACYIESLDTN